MGSLSSLGAVSIDRVSALWNESKQSVELCSVLCVFKIFIVGLTRTRDSIGRATASALGSANFGAAPRIIRMIADAMEKTTPAKRIDMLYLVDSILQVSPRNFSFSGYGMEVCVEESLFCQSKICLLHT